MSTAPLLYEDRRRYSVSVFALELSPTGKAFATPNLSTHSEASRIASQPEHSRSLRTALSILLLSTIPVIAGTPYGISILAVVSYPRPFNDKRSRLASDRDGHAAAMPVSRLESYRSTR